MNQAQHDLLFSGTVIPAHPLALNVDKSLDVLAQRALTHYYIDAGVGGIAVGVHTTQFEIRDPKFNLYEPVLRLAAEEVSKRNLDRPFLMIAGLSGPTEQACDEARLAKSLGYCAGLLSMGHLDSYSEEALLERTRAVAAVIPVIGFYLQPSAGGRILSFEFWTAFMNIDNVIAVKIAPFNRYQSLDVMKAVMLSKRCEEIAVYTGNDDNIIPDLLTDYEMMIDGKCVRKRIVGGLLGHWSVWTHTNVQLLERIKHARESQTEIQTLLTLGTQVTDTNAAFFDVRNNFKGCIAGINEVLARQGLMQGNWCLLDKECLSEGQSEYIDEVYERYPHLNDDKFVESNRELWKKYAASESI